MDGLFGTLDAVFLFGYLAFTMTIGYAYKLGMPVLNMNFREDLI